MHAEISQEYREKSLFENKEVIMYIENHCQKHKKRHCYVICINEQKNISIERFRIPDNVQVDTWQTDRN